MFHIVTKILSLFFVIFAAFCAFMGFFNNAAVLLTMAAVVEWIEKLHQRKASRNP